jgi:hypothetical protein
MDLYTYVVENFVIHDTRSLHSDTLTALRVEVGSGR